MDIASPPVAQVQIPRVVTKTAKELFKVLNASLPLQCFDQPWNTRELKTPAVKAGYVWDLELLKLLLMFHLSGSTAMKLIGHTGTGKTESVLQFYAALNFPVLTVVGNPHLEAFQLIGRQVPVAGGGLQWVDGPVVLAARCGYPLCIDEYNVIDPGEATGLNSFLEGKPYTIPDTGETVVPQPGFRVYATINPKTFGYTGRNTQDLANDDRFPVNVKLEYPPAAIEEAVVVSHLMTLNQKADESKNLAKLIVQGANAIRKAFMGESDASNALPCTMSRRGVLEWAKWTVLASSLEGAEQPFYRALDIVLGNRVDAESRAALRQIVQLQTNMQFEKGGP